MKEAVLIILFSVGMASFASSCPASDMILDERGMHNSIVVTGAEQDKASQAKPQYSCPMHPEIVQDKPGKCPKCGMNLTVKEAKKDVYTCPMHPEIVQDKAGKCPKCGMDLVKKEMAKKEGYTCPMHPEVVQDKAGKCPKCGMDLVKKEQVKKQ